MEQTKIQNLLKEVRFILERYNKINELTGENFNVFRILKLESSEVRMHSAFIAELLNPKGSHGQGEVFLKLFIDRFCFKQSKLDLESCKVEIEKHTGFINHDRTEGGRIDIVVTDKNRNHIIIENKIYAGDQKSQLVRYHNFSPKSHLIYLTLFGYEPSEESKGHLQSMIDYKCCSYSTDILEWLEACRKEMAVLPIIRESITQYINLIKYLTNHTINDAMNAELSNIILANLEESFLIADNLDNSLQILIDKLKTDLEDIALQTGLSKSINIHKEFKKNYTGFWFWDKKWRNVNIGFQFHNYDKSLIYGFQSKIDPAKKPWDRQLQEKLSTLNIGSLKQSNWWPISDMIESPFNNWEKVEAWRAIENGDFKEAVLGKIKMLLDITKGIQDEL